MGKTGVRESGSGVGKSLKAGYGQWAIDNGDSLKGRGVSNGQGLSGRKGANER